MLKVLVVDDSRAMRGFIARSLDRSGLSISEVYEAENGLEALSVLSFTWIDLVLCDVYMPQMNGLELARCMAKERLTAEVPIVIISADLNQQQIDGLRFLGVRGYLNKPFLPEALARTIRRALGLPGER